MKNIMNILLCVDDLDGNFTRHAAVTILSLLESNKKNKIKVFIISSGLPEKNINELKRIIKTYNQEIEFIIRDDIIPENMKKLFINRLNLPFGTYYRLFLSKYIKNVDRLLYLDCDVLVKKDISDIYNMDMKGKAIVGYYDTDPGRFIGEHFFHLQQYINAGVLLIDLKRFSQYKITEKLVNNINSKYGEHMNCSDQDYINIIFKDDIYVYNKRMNYFIISKFFNVGLDKAAMVHCGVKPYVQYCNVPKKLIKMYYKYLNLTMWKGYPEIKANYGYLKYIMYLTYDFLNRGVVFLSGNNLNFRRKIVFYLYNKSKNRGKLCE